MRVEEDRDDHLNDKLTDEYQLDDKHIYDNDEGVYITGG